MTVTTATLIADTQRLLLSGAPPQLNKLAAEAAANTGSLTFVNAMNGIKENTYLQIGLEVFYVWSISGTTATVQAAQQGSTAAAHDAGDLVTVSPKFPDHVILRALNDELNSLSSPTSGLYQTKTVDVTFDPTAGGFNLTSVTDLIDIVDIRAHRSSGLSKDWPLIDNWSIDRQQNTTDFPSGFALFVTDPIDTSATMRVRYRSGFGQLTLLSDVVTTVTGLPVTALDIPPLGAAIRLVHPREIRRNQIESQGDSRRGSEVQAGSVSGSVNALERDYRRRVMEEASRLSQFNPPSGYVPPAGPYSRRRVLSNRD